MESRTYNIRISPEVIKNKIFPKIYFNSPITGTTEIDPCCDIPPIPPIFESSGITYVYSSMTDILSGGTTGNSLLNITIPIYLSQNTVDIGYYSVFDGMVLQKDTVMNFLFTGSTSSPYNVNFFNTSDRNFKRYLKFSNYQIDWGDGSPHESVNSLTPTPYSHTYVGEGKYTIVMSGLSPWGYNVIKKDVYLPITNVNIPNPNGEAYFIPAGGNWSATPISYRYIYEYDTICETELPCCEFIEVPFKISGFTKSYLSDLAQYGQQKFVEFLDVNLASGIKGKYLGPPSNNQYTAYTINDIEYRDYPDGKTIFILESSGCTSLVCSAITKSEVLLNVISEPTVQSDVFVERGKNSALENIQRLGEVFSFGDLKNYGYKYFKIK